MNIRRITVGGLAAALVMSMGEFVIEPLFASTTTAFFTRLRLPAPGESAMVGMLASLLVIGWASVCMYAEFAVRSGRGAVTAAQTGALVWLLSCLVPNVILYSYGVMDGTFFWFASIWPLVSTVAGTIAGAAVHDGRRQRTAAVAGGT